MPDTAYRLPVFDTIKTSWKWVDGSKAVFMGALGLIFLISFGAGMISSIFKMLSPHIEILFNFVLQIVIVLLQVGVYYIGLQRAFNKPITATQVFHCLQYPLLFIVLGAYLLQIALFVLPSGLMFLPTALQNMGIASAFLSFIFYTAGIVLTFAAMFVGIRISLFYFFILDQNKNSWEAIKASYLLTEGNFWRMVGVYLLGVLILTISAIPLGIGLIWTIPLMNIMYATIYKQLMENRVR
jgi:uncharacterized membrane protein